MTNKGMALETVLRALADRTRLRLLNLLREGDVCVCYLVAALKMSQPTISRHLAYLRKSGLVAARREGLWMHYSMVLPENDAARSVVECVLQSLRRDAAMQRDGEQLRSACCAPEKFVRLFPAPVPTLRRIKK